MLNFLEDVPEETTELDGDAQMAVVARGESNNEERKQDPNETMFMSDVLEDVELQLQRYTIVGNDSAFKAYTKDSSYLQGASATTQK